MDPLKIVSYVVQKGFNATVGFVGLKLAVFDVDTTTGHGILALAIGAVLLIVAALIEYLVWRDTAFLLERLSKKMTDSLLTHLIAGRPGLDLKDLVKALGGKDS